jgi:hypothetical protein
MRSISRRLIAGWILVATVFASATPGICAESGILTIKADRPGAKIGQMFYGLILSRDYAVVEALQESQRDQ